MTSIALAEGLMIATDFLLGRSLSRSIFILFSAVAYSQIHHNHTLDFSNQSLISSIIREIRLLSSVTTTLLELA